MPSTSFITMSVMMISNVSRSISSAASGPLVATSHTIADLFETFGHRPRMGGFVVNDEEPKVAMVERGLGIGFRIHRGTKTACERGLDRE